MSQTPEWSAKITEVIAAEVRRYLKRDGMSVQKLSDEVGRVGLPIERPVLSNLINGRRRTISVAEWLALASALRVPPLLLLFPVGRLDEVEVLPGVEMDPWNALEWAESGGEISATHIELLTNTMIAMYREHDRAVSDWRDAGYAITRADEILANADLPESEAAPLRADRERFVAERARLTQQIEKIRAALCTAEPDVKLPRLPAGLRYIDDKSPQ